MPFILLEVPDDMVMEIYNELDAPTISSGFPALSRFRSLLDAYAPVPHSQAASLPAGGTQSPMLPGIGAERVPEGTVLTPGRSDLGLLPVLTTAASLLPLATGLSDLLSGNSSPPPGMKNTLSSNRRRLNACSDIPRLQRSQEYPDRLDAVQKRKHTTQPLNDAVRAPEHDGKGRRHERGIICSRNSNKVTKLGRDPKVPTNLRSRSSSFALPGTSISGNSSDDSDHPHAKKKKANAGHKAEPVTWLPGGAGPRLPAFASEVITQLARINTVVTVAPLMELVEHLCRDGKDIPPQASDDPLTFQGAIDTCQRHDTSRAVLAFYRLLGLVRLAFHVDR